MTTHKAQLDAPRLLTSAEVARRLRIGVKTLHRLTRTGVVPQPIRLGRKLLRWREDDIDRWLKDNPGGRE
jgi:excisionase family DNA binding protein